MKRPKRCGDGADQGEPEPSKLAKFATSLHQIEKKFGASNDLDDLRRQFLAAVAQFSSSRFRLGRELYSYRVALPHGAWGPLIAATSRALTISRRTLREILASYRIVKDAPPLVIQEFEDRGLDPAATKNLEHFRGTVQGLLAGLSPKEAFEQAQADAPRHEPPPQAGAHMTEDERWVVKASEAMIKGVEHVPENRKADILVASFAEVMWLLTKCREPIMITPTPPVVDRSGRRREPEPEPSPEPQPEPSPARSEAEVLALAQAAFFGDQPLVLSEADMAAIEQLVQKRIASVLESRTK
jgi:hypothetical protein